VFSPTVIATVTRAALTLCGHPRGARAASGSPPPSTVWRCTRQTGTVW